MLHIDYVTEDIIMTSYSCYPCKYLIYSLSWMSGLRWLLHIHSPLVHRRGDKKSPTKFLTCFSLLWKSLMKQYVTFYRILRFFDSYCFHGRSWLFHLTLLFLVQKHNFDLWPFFASFPDKLLLKTFGNKTFTFTALHICSKLFFFSFLTNHTD